ncbi:MAG: hypothetical protein OXE17_07360 [Chloroflexi bacterium]|nr:hypothetical protein [Chloroflexota bacterium]
MGPAAINIQMVRENLALSIAFWAAAQRGVITANSVPAKAAFKSIGNEFLEVDTPLELADNRELVRCVSNQIRSAFAFSAIQTYRSLETTYRGSPLQEMDNDLRGARCSFFVLNKTVAQNLLSPIWVCPPEFRTRFEVRDVPFSLDTSALDGKEVFWDHFGGLQSYLGLLEYCCLRVAEDTSDVPREDRIVEAEPSTRPSLTGNGKISTTDDVVTYIGERCDIGDTEKVIAKGLYLDYTEWCYQRGEEPLAQRSFGMQLTARGFHRQRRGKGRHWWMGLGLRTPFVPYSANGHPSVTESRQPIV